MIVVLPVLVLTPVVAWRYRYSGAAAYRPDWSFSWPIDIAIWGIPFAIVIVVAVWQWKSTHALDPFRPLSTGQMPLRVEVVGYDWKWLFIYPDLGIASMGQLAFPADRPVAFDLTSNTVLQSFFIPTLGSQIYAMAGMVTQLHLKAYAPGSFAGQNVQFNGDQFYRQKFTADAMTPADFEAWTDRVRAEGVPLSPEAYAAVQQRSTVEQTRKALGAVERPLGAIYFSGVSPGLFDNIVQSFHGGPTDVASLCSGAERAPRSANLPADHQPK